MKSFNTLCFLFLVPVSMIFSQDRITGKSFATRSEVIATHAMAATSHPLATQTALDILKQGGNAIDAAIAANAMLGLMEPTGNGIGGDLFAIVWDAKSKKLYGLNASGRSPEKLTLEYFKKNNHTKIPSHGALPVSVPGCVDGWYELHGKFGKLSMKNILQPTINYAREGFPVTELVAYYMQLSAKFLSKYPGFKTTYMPKGSAPKKGEIFKNPFLANTLEKIANEGRDAFYKGDIAKTIAKYVKENGGFLNYDDLKNHTSEWVEPVSTNYRGYDVWELPPNGQGIAALQMLNILEKYDIKSMGFGTIEYLHILTEAKKLAYEDRAKFYADPDFNTIPVDQLISKNYADQRRKLIDENKAAKTYDAGNLNDGDTIYLTVADEEGNMVSLIQSNYRGMGSGMTPTELGFILQDRGELFSLKEGHFNTYEPKKRPFHTIIPAFITKDGKPFMSFGLMGGGMQPQGHVQIIVNMIDFEMNLQEAGDAPRINHMGSSQPTGEEMTNGGTLHIESGISYETIRGLLSKGHNISYALGPYGGYQAIMVKDGVYYGASESRKDGQAAGY
ncbi:gamma-glutamyltranspeptidase/glutathione hydrolase [Aquimarina sp. EL_43]|uniref:gamma-glutamyltransferase n=1 Tax=unclassified Aquimarina TaxID=2627091 RepID=UPI0018CA84C4|nr:MULTISPECIES: gamma-glutamyltransferase [unclassified Aquimarina]MBG6132700.1 gamma-glutamyltranspeptidase/glutathione hydrolase [Aquimarina sp. EL_35]MBG6152830.1 gamma-glutamyltranspeptidase/glutathione hydrolase [Aquimarina sp. EL_32]MBG6170837.1 gamma-glutamyltranspeptidase/glutathione hydrolase [Aquimarina sp. EL_43]